VLHDNPHSPSTSPRSAASWISLVPGCHDLDLGAEHIAVKQREDVGIGARAFPAEGRRRDEELAEGLHRRIVARHAKAHLVGNAAEPGEFGAVELGFVDERGDALAARECADDGAVFRSDQIEIVGCLEAAGAAHVLRHDSGIAGNMLAEVARHQPSIGIVPAAHAVADDERQGLAFVEILDSGGGSGLRRNSGEEHGGNAYRASRDATS
jgi:hypothetical protein